MQPKVMSMRQTVIKKAMLVCGLLAVTLTSSTYAQVNRRHGGGVIYQGYNRGGATRTTTIPRTTRNYDGTPNYNQLRNQEKTVSVSSSADFEVDGISYRITSSDKKDLTVSVTKSGTRNGVSDYTGAVNIPDVVVFKKKEYRVTAIEPSAFEGSSITSVNIGDYVSRVGNSAFARCGSLTYVSFGSGVTTIEDVAFSGCERLASLSLHGNIQTIGRQVFVGCKGITRVELHCKEVGNAWFSGVLSGLHQRKSVVIGDEVTSIGSMAFSGCDALDEITIPHNVNYIDKTAFQGCGFSKVTLHCENVSACFKKMVGLREVVMGDEVKYIADEAFMDCISLSNVRLSPNVTAIGAKTFSGCEKLAKINLNNIKSVGDYAFQNCKLLNADMLASTATVKPTAFSYAGQAMPKIKQIDGLKTYQGDYTMRFGVLNEISGKASYQYKDAPDGTRIYEGGFRFETEKERYAGWYFVEGQFKNDRQIGKWVWTYQNVSDHKIRMCIITFDENGIPNGAFETCEGFSYGSTKHEDIRKDTYTKANITKGKVYSVAYKDRDMTASGRYDTNESGRYNAYIGQPTGEWEITTNVKVGNKEVKKTITMKPYSSYDGPDLEGYYFDDTTGDKKRLTINKAKKLYRNIINDIVNHCFRSTWH